MSYQLKARLLKQRLAVFNRATLPTSTSVVPKQTRTPLASTGFPEMGDIQINPQDGRSIADAYDGLKHNPNDPKVKASYGALIKETKSQYGDLIKGGLKPNASDKQYKNSDALHLDIENKRINFFPTSSGLGSTETGGIPTDHPMLQPSGVKINGKEVLNNDLFRIVHDVNGHFRGQASGFGPQGEQQAFLTHKQMFSPLAGKALFTETAGQNNWINFSKKFGASNRANPKNTVFAEQKAALFPDSIINSKVHQPRGRISKLKTKLAGFGLPPQRILDAFKAGKPAATKAFVSDGKKLLYNGNEVARHTRRGIEVSYAGYNSATTAATIRGLGIDTRNLKGVTTINGVKVDPESTNFTLVPTKNISKGKFRVRPQDKRKITPEQRKSIDEAEKFRRNMRIDETGSPTEVPEDRTQIQPRDQKQINSITGVKSPIGRKVRGVDAHHILSKEKFPGLRTNRRNAIPLSKPIHKELHRLNAKLVKVKQALITPLIKKKKTTKPIRRISVKEGMIQTAAMLSADAIINNFIKTKQNIRGVSGVFDPVENRILDATRPTDAMRLQKYYKSENNKLGLNSITDTRLGPESNIENVRGQMKDIEQRGGITALGFDNGSYEALDIIIGKSDNDIFSKLLEHQNSTGILDEDLTFRIENNPIFKSK